jgi:ECF sigma factor
MLSALERNSQPARRNLFGSTVGLAVRRDVAGDTGSRSRSVGPGDALASLAKHDPRKARFVELRFFGGLSVEETGEGRPRCTLVDSAYESTRCGRRTNSAQPAHAVNPNLSQCATSLPKPSKANHRLENYCRRGLNPLSRFATALNIGWFKTGRIFRGSR